MEMDLFTDELRATLGASDVKLVFKKRMTPSDRIKGQNRLLMSCKKKPEFLKLFASVLTQEEKKLVHRVEKDKDRSKGKRLFCCKSSNDNGKRSKKSCCSKNKDDDEPKEEENNEDNEPTPKQEKNNEAGLAVEAYDADGRSYAVALKYLTSNTAYRIKGSWSAFLSNNELLVHGAAADVVHIEVWAFRSPKLALGKKDHPHGSLGLLFLYRRGGEAEADEEVHDDAAPEPDDDEAVEEIEHEGHGEASMLQDDDEDLGGGAKDEGAVAAPGCADDDAHQADDAAGEFGAAAALPQLTRDPCLTLVESFIDRYSIPLLLMKNKDDDERKRKAAGVNNDSTAVQSASKGGDQSQTAG